MPDWGLSSGKPSKRHPSACDEYPADSEPAHLTLHILWMHGRARQNIMMVCPILGACHLIVQRNLRRILLCAADLAGGSGWSRFFTGSPQWSWLELNVCKQPVSTFLRDESKKWVMLKSSRCSAKSRKSHMRPCLSVYLGEFPFRLACTDTCLQRSQGWSWSQRAGLSS